MLTTLELVAVFGCSVSCLGGCSWLRAYFPNRPLAVSLAGSPLLVLSLWAFSTGAHALSGSWLVTVVLLVVFWGPAVVVAFLFGEELDLWRTRSEALLTSRNVDDRIWAAAHNSDTRRLRPLLVDSVPRVREAAVRGFARAAPFLEAIEVLRPSCCDSDPEVRQSAQTCFWELGGDLLGAEWRGVHGKLRELQETDRKRLEIPTAHRQGHTTSETHSSGPTELFVETRHGYHGVIVPEICCLCGLNCPTVRRERSWGFGDPQARLDFGLTLGFCRLCAHSDLESRSVRVESVRRDRDRGGLSVEMSFLNEEVLRHFSRANA